MARLVNVALFLFIPVMLFHLAGIGSSSYLLNTLNFINPEIAAGRSPIFSLIATLSAVGIGLGVGTVIAGAVLGRNLETILYTAGVGAMMGIFTALLIDYVFIYNELRKISEGFAIIMVAPLIFIGGIFIIEWILRKD